MNTGKHSEASLMVGGGRKSKGGWGRRMAIGWAVALGLSTGAGADTTITGSVVWGSGTVNLTDNLRIQGTLTVGAGVNVQIGSGWRIIVESGGTLAVNATSASPALFTSPARWAGVTFDPGSSGQVSHAVFERMTTTGITINGTSPVFTGCTIRDVLGAGTSGPAYGVRISGSAQPVIRQSLITNIRGTNGVSTAPGAPGSTGGQGDDGNNNHLDGYPGFVGGAASAAANAGNGGEAVAIFADGGAAPSIVSDIITDIRGANGGIGAKGGTGGFGGRGGHGWAFFGVGNGGRGGNAGAAGRGGDGGHGGHAVAIRLLNPAIRADISQNLITYLYAGNGGSGGLGGDGGNGGFGGWGAGTDIPFVVGGNGGDGGTGTRGGNGGNAGNAGKAIAFELSNAAVRAYFNQNTIAQLFRGVVSAPGGAGLIGPGGAPGGPGTGPGGSGSSGNEGQWVTGAVAGTPGLIGAGLGAMVSAPTQVVQLVAVNNILAIGSTGDSVPFRTGGSAIIASDSNCFHAYTVLFDGSGTTSLGFQFVLGDPRFVNGAAGDFHLQPGSAAIDAGDNSAIPVAVTADLDGLGRRFDDPATADSGLGAAPIVDIGVYEFRTTVPCPADSDGNGQITPADVAYFINIWFTSLTQGTLAGDFNGNGIIDPSDVAAYINAWFTALTDGC